MAAASAAAAALLSIYAHAPMTSKQHRKSNATQLFGVGEKLILVCRGRSGRRVPEEVQVAAEAKFEEEQAEVMTRCALHTTLIITLSVGGCCGGVWQCGHAEGRNRREGGWVAGKVCGAEWIRLQMSGGGHSHKHASVSQCQNTFAGSGAGLAASSLVSSDCRILRTPCLRQVGAASESRDFLVHALQLQSAWSCCACCACAGRSSSRRATSGTCTCRSA